MYWIPIQRNEVGSISAIISFQKSSYPNLEFVNTDAYLIPNRKMKANLTEDASDRDYPCLLAL